VETIHEPLIVLTSDPKVLSANRSFYETFQVATEEPEGRFVYSIGDHSLNIPVFFLLRGKGFFDILIMASSSSAAKRRCSRRVLGYTAAEVMNKLFLCTALNATEYWRSTREDQK
jgi:hypothetical protein